MRGPESIRVVVSLFDFFSLCGFQWQSCYLRKSFVSGYDMHLIDADCCKTTNWSRYNTQVEGYD